MLEYDAPVDSPPRPPSRSTPVTSPPLKRNRKSQAVEWCEDEVSDDDQQPAKAITLEQQMAAYNYEPRSQTGYGVRTHLYHTGSRNVTGGLNWRLWP